MKRNAFFLCPIKDLAGISRQYWGTMFLITNPLPTHPLRFVSRVASTLAATNYPHFSEIYIFSKMQKFNPGASKRPYFNANFLRHKLKRATF